MTICITCSKRARSLVDKRSYACRTNYMTLKEQREYDEELREAAQSAADGAPEADGTGRTGPVTPPHRNRGPIKYDFIRWDYPWT